LLVQFQGMIAEYERAQIIERIRRGKTHRARQGTVNVLSGAPFGYRYVRKNEHADARYEVVVHEAAILTELFRRYVEDGATIADLARWLTATAVPTRSGKSRWDRSVIWGMLRNPAYAGRACFGKTMRTGDQPGLNRTARLAGRSTPKSYSVTDRPARTGWRSRCRPWWQRTPGSVSSDAWPTTSATPPATARSRPCSKAWPPAPAADTPTTADTRPPPRATRSTTTGVGSDNYRYEHGRVCDNKPVRTDYLDTLVWDHITDLLANPTLIRAEINRRLDQLRTADPTTAQRQRLEQALAKASASITRLIKAYQEELISLDELRERMPELRSRETSLRNQLDALTSQLVDREVYLQLATGLEDFLAQLRNNATTTIPDQQRVLRLLVKDVLIGPERILIRHSIPAGGRTTNPTRKPTDDEADEEPSPSSPLRWRSHRP
jgi:site-specific DNA recombinase